MSAIRTSVPTGYFSVYNITPLFLTPVSRNAARLRLLLLPKDAFYIL